MHTETITAAPIFKVSDELMLLLDQQYAAMQREGAQGYSGTPLETAEASWSEYLGVGSPALIGEVELSAVAPSQWFMDQHVEGEVWRRTEAAANLGTRYALDLGPEQPRSPGPIVIVGKPGAGKGTVAARLAREFDMDHVSTGDLLRRATTSTDSRFDNIRAIMDAGGMVGDDDMIDLVENTVFSDGRPGDTIYDGFPRTMRQAEWLRGRLAEVGARIGAIIPIEADDDVVVGRLTGRNRGPDDQEDRIRTRLGLHEKQTQPVIDYYHASGDPVHVVDGNQNTETVYDQAAAVVSTAVTASLDSLAEVPVARRRSGTVLTAAFAGQ